MKVGWAGNLCIGNSWIYYITPVALYLKIVNCLKLFLIFRNPQHFEQTRFLLGFKVFKCNIKKIYFQLVTTNQFLNNNVQNGH